MLFVGSHDKSLHQRCFAFDFIMQATVDEEVQKSYTGITSFFFGSIESFALCKLCLAVSSCFLLVFNDVYS